MANIGIEANIVKGIGTVGKNFGKFIGGIPLIKEGPVDEFLQEKGLIDEFGQVIDNE